MEKTYKITAKTNGYIASRDIRFKGNTEVTLHSGLSLKEAQDILLNMFNEDNDRCFPNWGLAVAWSRKKIDCAYTYQDGSRTYSYDSRYYYIEEED